MVHSITEASEAIGLSPFFVGVIVVAVVGNAAEHWVAVLVAAKNKMDLAVNIAVGLMSEILVDSITETAEKINLSEFFIGAVVVAIVGNAAEHWVAVLVAAKNKMDLAVNIAVGSSAQIALFVAPVLVLCSFFLGPHPMPLVFNAFEIGGVIIAVLIASQVTNHGESTWYMGLQLLAVYVVLGLAFLFA